MKEQLLGLITEQHLDAAEEEFPGISQFFAVCEPKPPTFLQLVWRYECTVRAEGQSVTLRCVAEQSIRPRPTQPRVAGTRVRRTLDGCARPRRRGPLGV